MRVRSFTALKDTVIVARPNHPLKVALAATLSVALVACGSSTSPDSPAFSARALHFHQDSATHLVTELGSCSTLPVSPCYPWARETAEHTGTFESSAFGLATITLDGKDYHASFFHADSQPNLFSRQAGECGSVTVRARVVNGTLIGSLEHVLNCHALARAGHFTIDTP